MAKKDLIPKPESVFLKIKCKNCGNEQLLFNCASTQIKCIVCEELLSEPQGGRASIKGEIIQELG
ncbi:30S ribosomal protein S27e [[Eubacterium] cellulosolvens]